MVVESVEFEIRSLFADLKKDKVESLLNSVF